MADDKSMVNVSEKRKKGSKKSKKSWRKATDIVDVEEHLEDVRREERTGGVISEKDDTELFFIEKKLDENEGVTKDIPKRKKVDKVSKEEESSDEEEFVPRKDRLKMKRKKEIEEEIKQQAQAQTISTDAWATKKEEPKNIWLEDTFQNQPKKPKTVGQKQSSLPAVDVCESGASYNPEYDSHQELLQKALDQELKIAKQQEKLNRKIKFLSQEEYKQNPSWFEEMSEGLDGKNKEEKSETTTEQDDEVILPKTVLSIDKKTKKQRRKEKERTDEERVKENEKLNKVRLNDIYRLKTLKKELKREELEKELRTMKKDEIEKKKANEPKRLGKYKYEKPKVVYQLSEELSGSLRSLKPEGNPFLERMKSLQKRNIIEPRKRVLPHRKYKMKEVEKRSYKKPTVKDFSSKT